jgi:hypothetical protein
MYTVDIVNPYLKGNTLHLRYRAQPVNAVWETSRCFCENNTEHTDTVRTSQETHYVSTTEPNRLILFGETVAVYCENHKETHRYSSYLTRNTLRLHYRAQPVNAV